MKYLKALLFLCGCSLSAASLKVTIQPFGRSILFQKNEELNLTCKVGNEAIYNETFDLSWILPIKESDIASRVNFVKTHNTLSLTVTKLQKTDSGLYVCEVRNGTDVQNEKVNIVVNTDRTKCLPPFFDCGNMLCIPLQYVCDGYHDCPDRSDESFEHCGDNACEGKIFCDGRCISKKYCCDHRLHNNCTNYYVLPCCQAYNKDLFAPDIFVMDSSDSPVTYKYHNLRFYQSTIYTMISCAVAFIFMSTLMLVAVCRIRMRRNAWFLQSRHSSSRQRSRLWPRPVVQSDCHVNANANSGTAVTAASQAPHPDESDPMENFVLLTYDSNTGFEVAEYGPKPPPYAESNIGIPPPPYSSVADIPAELTAIKEEGSEQRFLPAATEDASITPNRP